MDEDHVGLLVGREEGHLVGRQLLEDEGDILQGVHHELLEDLLVEIQGVAHHQGGEVLGLDSQDRVLAEGVLLVGLVAWIQVVGRWVCLAWILGSLACHLPSASEKVLSGNWS